MKIEIVLGWHDLSMQNAAVIKRTEKRGIT